MTIETKNKTFNTRLRALEHGKLFSIYTELQNSISNFNLCVDSSLLLSIRQDKNIDKDVHLTKQKKYHVNVPPMQKLK